ncbi:MAG TPA: N-acetylmuramoyl-L-alanine amidase-like domain-containing protein, partial [Syntrophorhabdales bacterium]|nr:N-acetylmuramoyl-L-alanine amidase-like domain-containing protein [Syntrophorhabdales bacterium]
ISFISGVFLGIPYGESTLLGGKDVAEALVIDLESMDCFTFIDYVEAMRLSSSFGDFRGHLRKVRYRGAMVTYGTRRHFFTDWRPTRRVRDVTREVGGKKVGSAVKTLNRKADGSPVLTGIPEKERRIIFVPTSLVDRGVLGSLRTGDYVGIYTEAEGLDVSHVGIIIRDGRRLLFRHASSVKRKVLDQDFLPYINGKPGIVVLRPEG